MSRLRLVGLVGPTATGKTDLALELASRLDADVVSADARQIYRGLDIGTGKPTAAEQARVPHHCLDLADPTERFDVARYRTAAVSAIDRLAQHGRRALLVGGTGLYVRAVLRGLCGGTPARPDLRHWLAARESEAPGTLARWASRLDPVAAGRIHPHDGVRLVRAIEVALTTGRPLSERQHAHGFADAPYDVLLIGLAVPTPLLDERIAARVTSMVGVGWLDEVARLAQHLPLDAPAWRTLGYPEMRAVVEGRLGLTAAVAATVSGTRRFAKRQRTWFRREPGLVWRDPKSERARILDEAAAFLVAKPRDAG